MKEQIYREREFFNQRLLRWWEGNSRSFSWRDSRDRYEVLIAELLLRRTNAAAVHPVYQEFLKTYPTLTAFTDARPEDIENLVRRLGLHWRAANMVQLADYFRKNSMEVPYRLQDLSELPGVGAYVARAVLVNCSDFKTVPIDGNVVRVVCRFFGMQEDDSLRRNKRFQTAVDSLVENVEARDLNFALLDFSALVCTRRKPKCLVCPIAEKCRSIDKFSDRSEIIED